MKIYNYLICLASFSVILGSCSSVPEHCHIAGEPVKENEVEPTCTTDGGYDLVTYCTEDHQEISREHVIVSALGHDYQFDSFVWNDSYEAKAKYICSHDDTHIEYYDAEVTGVITTAPDADNDGVKTYTAAYDGHSDSVEEVLPATATLDKLEFVLNSDEVSYTVKAKNKQITGEVIIPSRYSNLPVTNVKGFNLCDISAISIPNSVTRIDTLAFSHCLFLYTIDIPNSVTTIGEAAFQFSGLTSITIPSSVTTIGKSAFSYCSFTSVFIPSSVTSIGEGAFTGYDITVDENNPNYCSVDYALFNKSKTVLISFPRSFSGEYTVPNGVTEIGKSAFRICQNLTSISFPHTLISIGDSAFSNCSGLTSISIPNSVESIGNNGFSGCTSLKTITFEDNSQLRTLYEYAFDGCSSLLEITLPKSLHNIWTAVFRNCSSLTAIYVEAGSETYCSSNGILYSSDMTQLVKCPEGVIGSFVVPSQVISLLEEAFYKCNFIASVTFEAESELYSIGTNALSGCSSLTYLKFPKTLRHIWTRGLCYNQLLTSIDFDGTIEEWNAVTKRAYWCQNTPLHVIHCSNGDVNIA